jgi:hypothetical protein
MQRLILLLLVFCFKSLAAQELFVFTEPASNMAAKGFGLRLNNYLMKESGTEKYNYHLVPEVMWGASKHIMLHAEAFLSNRNNNFVAEGGAIYAKYRFYSSDWLHRHFRMAAFARYSFNNSDIHQQAIDLNGHNSGYDAGLIATRLKNKVAVSTTVSYLHALDNNKEKFVYGSKNRNAVSYTVSIGKLMLPKEYTSYKQTNVNLMFELLGQTNLSSGYSFIDIAPSMQLIFLSRMRVDVSYRIPLLKDLSRTSPGGYFVRVEYNIFNAY